MASRSREFGRAPTSEGQEAEARILDISFKNYKKLKKGFEDMLTSESDPKAAGQLFIRAAEKLEEMIEQQVIALREDLRSLEVAPRRLTPDMTVAPDSRIDALKARIATLETIATDLDYSPQELSSEALARMHEVLQDEVPKSAPSLASLEVARDHIRKQRMSS